MYGTGLVWDERDEGYEHIDNAMYEILGSVIEIVVKMKWFEEPLKKQVLSLEQQWARATLVTLVHLLFLSQQQ